MTNRTLDENWIHFINIGGVTTAPLAKALKEKGFKITGTDTNLYDPIKSYLNSNSIKVFKKYTHENLLTYGKMPHKVIAGSGISLKNREYLFARKQNIEIKHFPELLQEQCIVDNSIVIVGTFGKTTITSVLIHLFEASKIDISYMFGGLTNANIDPLRLSESNTKYSIVEGDEYISSRWDPISKFFYYKPKYLLLTSIQWDHTDIFKTEDDYVANFKKLVRTIPEEGLIFASKDDKNIKEVVKSAKCKVEFYTRDEIFKWSKKNDIQSSVFGKLNRKNSFIAAKFATCFDITKETIRDALQSYTGIKRRLEVKYPRNSSKLKVQSSGLVILDDFASSPPKVVGSLKSIKEELPEHKLFVIFEPNAGNRTAEALANFKGVFVEAQEVLLPRFEKLISSKQYPVDEDKLKDFLKRDSIEVQSFDSDEELIEYCYKLSQREEKVGFVFMASFGMEERIASLIQKLKANS